MKKTFAVGDRVAFYRPGYARQVGSVANVDDCVLINYTSQGDRHTTRVHPMQCRKIKPPTPLKRVWLPSEQHDGELRCNWDWKNKADFMSWVHDEPTQNLHAYTEYVEVRKPKQTT